MKKCRERDSQNEAEGNSQRGRDILERPRRRYEGKETEGKKRRIKRKKGEIEDQRKRGRDRGGRKRG